MGRESPEMGTPYELSRRNLRPFLPEKRDREKQTNKFGFFSINLEIQRDLKRRVGGRQFKGRGPRPQETDGAHFSASPSHARVSQSCPARSRLRELRRRARAGPPPLELGLRGGGRAEGGARPSYPNWIRERRGESHGRVREQGGRGPGRWSRRAGQLSPPAAAQPSPNAGRERAFGRSCRLPGEEICP